MKSDSVGFLKFLFFGWGTNDKRFPESFRWVRSLEKGSLVFPRGAVVPTCGRNLTFDLEVQKYFHLGPSEQQILPVPSGELKPPAQVRLTHLLIFKTMLVFIRSRVPE